MRWENYFLQSDTEFPVFWQEYLGQQRDMIYIMELGFDPRSVVGIESIYGMQGKGLRDVMIVRYYKNEHDRRSKNHPQVENNLCRLQVLIDAKRCKPYSQKDIVFRSDEDISVTVLESSKVINDFSD